MKLYWFFVILKMYMIIFSFEVEKISNGRIYYNRSVYLFEFIYLLLNCGVIFISKIEREGGFWLL